MMNYGGIGMMNKNNQRVTVDFDEQSYYLDGEYWESWDNYGEEMAERINELLNELDKENRKLKNELNLLYLKLKEENKGFDKLHKMYIEQIEENNTLKLNNDILIEMVQGYQKWSEKRSKFL